MTFERQLVLETTNDRHEITVRGLALECEQHPTWTANVYALLSSARVECHLLAEQWATMLVDATPAAARNAARLAILKDLFPRDPGLRGLVKEADAARTRGEFPPEDALSSGLASVRLLVVPIVPLDHLAELVDDPDDRVRAAVAARPDAVEARRRLAQGSDTSELVRFELWRWESEPDRQAALARGSDMERLAVATSHAEVPHDILWSLASSDSDSRVGYAALAKLVEAGLTELPGDPATMGYGKPMDPQEVREHEEFLLREWRRRRVQEREAASPGFLPEPSPRKADSPGR